MSDKFTEWLSKQPWPKAESKAMGNDVLEADKRRHPDLAPNDPEAIRAALRESRMKRGVKVRNHQLP